MQDRFRILLVDQNEFARQGLMRALSDKFDVVLACNAPMVCERLPYYEPDLAIVDLGHHLEGLEACKAVRGMPEGNQVPLVVLSDTDDAETARTVYGAGGNLMLRKPVDPLRLIRNIDLSLAHLGAPRSKKNPLDPDALKIPLGKPPEPKATQPVAAPRSPSFTPPPATPPPIPTPPRNATPIPTETPLPKSPTPAKPSPFTQVERSDVFLERNLIEKENTEKKEEAERKARAAESSHIPRIMIVDDDPDTVELVQVLLGGEFELLGALDGLQALERIYEYEPDIVILDVMMPKMNGYQLCTALRRNPECPDIPIVFLSAKSARKDREYAFHCGATEYMTKPFDAKKLKELIDDIVKRTDFRIRPKQFSYRDIHIREREMMRDREDLLHVRERRKQYEQLKSFIKKNE